MSPDFIRGMVAGACIALALVIAVWLIQDAWRRWNRKEAARVLNQTPPSMKWASTSSYTKKTTTTTRRPPQERPEIRFADPNSGKHYRRTMPTARMAEIYGVNPGLWRSITYRFEVPHKLGPNPRGGRSLFFSTAEVADHIEKRVDLQKWLVNNHRKQEDR